MAAMKRVAVAVPLVAAAAAQSAPYPVEWTSFEDRMEHAMAVDPSGNALLFGGETVSTAGGNPRVLKDTVQFGSGNGLTAQERQPIASPGTLFGHAMAGSINPSNVSAVVLFGGTTGIADSGRTHVWS